MREVDYPALFRGANSASMSGQARFLRLFLVDLVLLVLGALLTSIAVASATHLRLLRGGAALAFASSIIITLIIQQRNDEEAWYGGRAAAESVKSRTWLYMMAAEPFSRSLTSQESDRRFAEDLSSILRQQEQLGIRLEPGVSSDRTQITEVMREIRNMNLSEKVNYYQKYRVDDQCSWYSEKARANHRTERRYYWIIVGLQGAALIAAIVMAVWPSVNFNFMSVLATAAVAFLSWNQLKKHRELAQVYEITSNELGLVSDQLRHITSHEELSGFVKDAESAISREHTLWVARRSFRLRWQ